MAAPAAAANFPVLQASDVKLGAVLGLGTGTARRGQWRGQEVAVKKLKLPPSSDSEALAEFQRELAVLCSLCSDKLVQVTTQQQLARMLSDKCAAVHGTHALLCVPCAGV